MLKQTKAFSSFSVDDLQKAKVFYGEKLGLNITKNDMGVLEMQIEGSSNIMIYPKPDHTAATFTVLNFPVEDIEASVDQLIGAGVKFEQYDGQIKTDDKGICRNPNGHAIAWFKDPAGNILSIVQKSN